MHIRPYFDYVSRLHLSAKSLRVLLALMSDLAIGSYASVNQNRLASRLEMTKSDISKAISALVKIGLLEINQISERKKTIALVSFTKTELDDMILSLGKSDGSGDDYIL